MTESGQGPENTPNQHQPDVPDWAPGAPSSPEPAPAPSAPSETPIAPDAVTMRLPTRPPAAPPPPAPVPAPDPAPTPAPTAAPAPADIAATMRLIPVPNAAHPATNPPAMTAARQIGKYRIKSELGRGGMGAVYLAEQMGLGREVAIKELIPSEIG